MRTDRHLFFRKKYIPWYDTTVACWILISLLFLIGLFALSGVTVAGSDPDLIEYVWIPGLLAGLSIFLMVKIGIRLWRRSRNE